MNLKSYLRGIGAGLIIAALIMGVAMKQPSTPDTTDNQTLLESTTGTSVSTKTSVSTATSTESETSISVDSQVSTETSVSAETSVSTETSVTEASSASTETENNTGEPSGDEDSSLPAEDSTGTSASAVEETDQNTTASDEANSETQTSVPDEGNGEDETEYVTITIEKGDSSKNVARKVYTAGLVESAPAFDKYLCSNGYDKSIKVGTFKIPVGSDNETIAKIISKKK